MGIGHLAVTRVTQMTIKYAGNRRVGFAALAALQVEPVFGSGQKPSNVFVVFEDDEQ